MPPWVLISPSSTVSAPGPTCFQPVRSLPLNSCFHSACGRAAATAQANAATPSIQTILRIKPSLLASRAGVPAARKARELRSPARPRNPRPSERQVVQIVVALGDARKGVAGKIVFDEVVLDSGLLGVGEDVLP